MSDKHSQKRRTVLKSVPVTASGFFSIGIVNADPPSEFHGFKYEPGPQKIIDEASGTFNRNKKKISGQLNLGSESYELNGVSARRTRSPHGVPLSSFVKNTPSKNVTKGNMNGELTKRLNIVSVNNGGITGFIKPPGQDRTAFSLIEKSESTEKIQKMLKDTAAK